PNCVPTKFRFQAESFNSTSTTLRSDATWITETPAPRKGGYNPRSLRNRSCPSRRAMRCMRLMARSTLPRAHGLALLLGCLLVIVRRVELGSIRSPRGLLERHVDLAQTFGREAQGDDLADPHHHIPGENLDAVRRKLVVIPVAEELLVDLVQVLRLIVLEEYREQHRSCRLRRLRMLLGGSRLRARGRRQARSENEPGHERGERPARHVIPPDREVLRRHFGCCVMRRYGLGDFQPCGNCFFASSSLTEPAMITSCPCVQFAGVATLCFAVSWMESSTRKTSSKLRPVVMGYIRISLIFLSGPTTKTARTVALSAGVRVFASPETEPGSMS